MPFKPDGYSSVSPYLIVSDGAATIRFLEEALGAKEIRRFAGEDGFIHHAEVRLDDSIVMLAEGQGGFPPVPAHVHVYVPDVDAAYAQALRAGGQSVQEPMKKDDPDRRCGVRDAGGTTWWLSTTIEF